ncbi:MAG: hypothetical protein CSA49_06390 [Gammaproteobacteria bacterium]|nr:MAG: hypothetical protein CSA49_06390 [Gammaproteobacteria bacterium]
MKILEPSKLNFTSTILDQKIKSIYLAAPHQGAGSTTCAYSLARALSRLISEKVILIDGNPGPGSLTEQLRLKDSLGFSDLILSGGRGTITKAIHNVEGEGFHVISTGQQEVQAPIAGERPSLNQLIESLTDTYSYVIYDGPPIHKSNEPLALAAAFDGVVLVLETNETRWEVANSAKEKLIQAGANVIGAIFNKRRYYVPQWVYDLL